MQSYRKCFRLSSGNADINGIFYIFHDYDCVVAACRNCIFRVVKRIAVGSCSELAAIVVKIQKCNIDERNKIEDVNSETARGEAWGTGGAGTRI